MSQHLEQLYLPHEAKISAASDNWPITIEEVAAFCGVTDESLAEQLISSACSYFTQKTGHQLSQATFTQKWDDFPCELRLDWSPVQSVTWLKYYATTGTLTTLATDQYWASLDARPSKIIPAWGVIWPITQYGRPESVMVQYVAGYASFDLLDEGIRRALFGLVSLWSKLPEPVVWNGGVPQDVPHSLNALMGVYSMKGLR